MTIERGQKPWPVTVEYCKKQKYLEIHFDDGAHFKYSAEYLRVESPSAEVQGHGASQKKIIGGCQNVSIKEIEPVGNYALRLLFDDQHSTGIYSWVYLYQLGLKKDENWSRYLSLIQNLGISR